MFPGICASFGPSPVNLATERGEGALSFLSKSPCLFKDNIISLDGPSYLPFCGNFGAEGSLHVSYYFIPFFHDNFS